MFVPEVILTAVWVMGTTRRKSRVWL